MDKQEFLDTWGQTHSELCANLNYFEDSSDDLIMIDYFFYDDLWIPKSNSFYTEEQQAFADELRHSI